MRSKTYTCFLPFQITCYISFFLCQLQPVLQYKQLFVQIFYATFKVKSESIFSTIPVVLKDYILLLESFVALYSFTVKQLQFSKLTLKAVFAMKCWQVWIWNKKLHTLVQISYFQWTRKVWIWNTNLPGGEHFTFFLEQGLFGILYWWWWDFRKKPLMTKLKCNFSKLIKNNKQCEF